MNNKIPPSSPQFEFSPELQRFLLGRRLLLNEIPFSKEDIYRHIQIKYIAETPGLSRVNKRWLCQRCNNRISRLFSKFPCASCGRDCVYCRKCLMMGRVSECTSFYHWTGPSLEWKADSHLQWEGRLSKGQEAASKAVVSAVRNKDELLVWAV